MNQKKYSGFTLVEMLIVMGILSVLMAIGVSVARFAIQRANNIQHQNAVDQFYQALQSYYTDNRQYPLAGTAATPQEFQTFAVALGSTGVLGKYVDSNFDGGSPAFFYYLSATTGSPQDFLICVSFAATPTSTDKLGGYCNGNGFGKYPTVANAITTKILSDADFVAKVHDITAGKRCSFWDAPTRAFIQTGC